MDTRPDDVSIYRVGEQNCKRDTLIRLLTVCNTGKKYRNRCKSIRNNDKI